MTIKKILLMGVFSFLSGNSYAQGVLETIDLKISSGNSREINKLIPRKSKLEVLSKESTWSEGPVVLPNGDIIWSDVVGNRVMQWNEREGTKVWLYPAQFHNGHGIDREGRVIAASHGKRAVERLEKNGEWKVLVDLYGDKKLNSPNDLVISKNGEIWFTDPVFGIKQEDEGYGGNQVLDGEYVFRFNPVTNKLVKLDSKEVVIPNGIAFSKDEKILYVTDSQVANDESKTNNNRNLVAFDIDKDRNISNGRVIAQFDSGVPDGIAVDERGNIWATSGKDIYIVSPQGKRLGKLNFPENVGNLVFAKKNNQNIVYITASQYLFRLKVLVGGVK